MNRLCMLLKNFQKLQLDNLLFIRLAYSTLSLNCAHGKYVIYLKIHSTGMIEYLLYHRYIEYNYDSYCKLPF